jgi:transcriptional regulator with XRE-family HTH domain
MSSNDLVATNVRRFRLERQLSLGELGRLSKLSKQTLSKLERGSGNPTVETLEQVATSLGVSLRALLSELGSEVRVSRSPDAVWNDLGVGRFRPLDQIYGSGYVSSSILRLIAVDQALERDARGRGSLALVYVIEGQVRMGPLQNLVDARAGDFVRFPAELPHRFEALAGPATLHVLTTSLQLTRSDDTGRGAPSVL